MPPRFLVPVPVLVLALAATMARGEEQAGPTSVTVLPALDLGRPLVFTSDPATGPALVPAPAEVPAPVQDGLSLRCSGVHLGGLTGLTALGKLEYHTGIGLDPFIDGGIGLSGGRYGVGLFWEVNDLELVRAQGPGFNYRVSARSGLAPKVVMVHRWNDDDDRLDAWYGKDTPRSRYVGFEVDVLLGGLSIAPGIYRSMDDHETYGAVSYGIGF